MLGFATTQTYAQNEVRGVETKLVKYIGSSYSYSSSSRIRESKYYNTWFGYEFHNMNSIPVSVDAKLYRKWSSQDDYTLINTKSFVLNSKESYIWKHENDNHFRVYYTYESSQDTPTQTVSSSASYYIEYKAYKLE